MKANKVNKMGMPLACAFTCQINAKVNKIYDRPIFGL